MGTIVDAEYNTVIIEGELTTAKNEVAGDIWVSWHYHTLVQRAARTKS